MANLFETGTAADADDLLGKMCTFCVNVLGWTRDDNSAAGIYRVYDPNDPDGMRYHFREYTDGHKGIEYYMSLSHSGADGWKVQSSAVRQYYATRTSVWNNTGPWTGYYFFSDADKKFVWVTIEVSAGQYNHFCFGRINKWGAFTGGQVCASQRCEATYTLNSQTVYRHLWYTTNNSAIFFAEGYGSDSVNGNYIYVPNGGNNRYDFVSLDDEVSGRVAYGSNWSLSDDDAFQACLVRASSGQYVGRHPLLPEVLWLHDNNNSFDQPLGQVPLLAATRLDRINSGDVIDSRVYLPLTRKSFAGNDGYVDVSDAYAQPSGPYSGSWGYAIERVSE